MVRKVRYWSIHQNCGAYPRAGRYPTPAPGRSHDCSSGSSSAINHIVSIRAPYTLYMHKEHTNAASWVAQRFASYGDWIIAWGIQEIWWMEAPYLGLILFMGIWLHIFGGFIMWKENATDVWWASESHFLVSVIEGLHSMFEFLMESIITSKGSIVWPKGRWLMVCLSIVHYLKHWLEIRLIDNLEHWFQ